MTALSFSTTIWSIFYAIWVSGRLSPRQAQLLALSYHQRWEVENTIGELKIHLLGRKTHVRSQNPREVVQ